MNFVENTKKSRGIVVDEFSKGPAKKLVWITFLNMWNDMPQKVLKISNNKSFKWNITFLPRDSYTDIWRHN